MLDFGWLELLLIAVVAIFVIGPKDIPKMMYGLGRILRRVQYVRFAVSQQFEDLMQAGDMDDLRKSVNFEEKRREISEGDAPQEENQYDEAAYDDSEELDIEAHNKERLAEIESQQKLEGGTDDISSK